MPLTLIHNNAVHLDDEPIGVDRKFPVGMPARRAEATDD